MRPESRLSNDPAELFACLKKRPLVLWLLALFLLAALALRVGIQMQTESVAWGDEIFQSREPAHHLVYGNWVTTWEYRVGARSWVFPAVISVVMRLTALMGPGSRGYLAGIEIFFSLISLLTIIFAALFAYRSSGLQAAIVAAFGCGFWYEIVYYAPRALTEVVAANLLLPGLYLGAYSSNEGKVDRKRLALAFLLCGLAVALRIHLAPVALLAMVWFCWGRWKETLTIALLCVGTPLLIFGIVDAFTWSYPFQSYIENIRFNATVPPSRFGTSPVYWYVVQLVRHFALLIPLAFLGVTRLPLLACAALAVLIPHSLIPHKEFRYLNPMFAIVVILAAVGWVELCAWFRRRYSYRWGEWFPAISGCIFFALLSAQIAWLFPNWHRAAAGDILLRGLSTDSSLCGLGVVGDPWYEEAQYTYLHRNVPIYLIADPNDLARTAGSFNAMLSKSVKNPGQFGFEKKKCVRGVCLYERTGGCSPDPQDEIDNYLKRTNQ